MRHAFTLLFILLASSSYAGTIHLSTHAQAYMEPSQVADMTGRVGVNGITWTISTLTDGLMLVLNEESATGYGVNWVQLNQNVSDAERLQFAIDMTYLDSSVTSSLINVPIPFGRASVSEIMWQFNIKADSLGPNGNPAIKFMQIVGTITAETPEPSTMTLLFCFLLGFFVLTIIHRICYVKRK